MGKGKALLYLLKFILAVALFCGAVYFENAQQQRLILLVALFAAFLGSGLVRIFIKPALCKKQEGQENRRQQAEAPPYFYLTFCLDVALVFFMEQNSRLLINYFFHSVYLIVLLEAVLTLSLKKGLAVGGAAVLASMVKYGFLIYYKPNLASISQMGFFLLAGALILAVAGFAQYNREERQRKDILYKDLLDAHRQLKQYADEVNRLSVPEEGEDEGKLRNPGAEQPKEQLTEREIDICRLIAKGKNNQEIARELFLSTGTVKNHITRILIKLDMRDRTQLAIFTIKNGL